MRASLRKTLISSHVAAVAIAVLIFQVLDDLVRAVGVPLLSAITSASIWISLLVMERELPSDSAWSGIKTALIYTNWLSHFTRVVLVFAAIWLLARLVYGTGPFKCLSLYRDKLRGKPHA
jgi:hypothetical protein